MLKFTFCLSLALTSAYLQASTQEAITAYDQRDYKTASSLFEKELNEGLHNGSILYNLGNTYYRLGEKGQAVAAYLAARKLMPRDPDIRANLKFVHEQGSDRLSTHQPLSIIRALCFWVDHSTPKEIFYLSSCLASLAFWLLFFSLAFKKLRSLRAWALVISCLAFIGFMMFSTSLFYEENWGAVTAPLAKVRSGPGEQNTVVFELHSGAPFIVEAVENGWYRILLSDAKLGWLSAQDSKVFLLKF